MSGEDWPAALTFQLKALKLPDGEREWRFHPERRWRFDLAWPSIKVAVEIDGGVWTGGRHVTGAGVENDQRKLNEAAILGWRVICVTPRMVRDGEAVTFVERILADRPRFGGAT